MNRPAPHRVLYVIGCAAPILMHIRSLLIAAHDRDWDTCLILTPSASRWLQGDLPGLETLTGYPVRSSYKLPGEPDVLPPPTAMLAAPVTSNSINKWAAGISDTLALGLLTEAIGKRLPLVAMPALNPDQVAHPAFPRSVEFLRAAGVAVLLDEKGEALRGTGEDHRATYPWHVALDRLDSLLS